MTSRGSVDPDAPLRLFLALELPGDVRDGLEAWSAAELGSAERRLRGDDLHVTLAFLGSRPRRELAAITACLEECAGASPMGPLAPRAWRETRSVGMVVLDDPTACATRLAERLADGLERLGVYEREARPWLPHVTVIRFRSRPRLDPPLPPIRTFVPSDAAAYVSRLHPTGARYEVLARVALQSTESESIELETTARARNEEARRMTE